MCLGCKEKVLIVMAHRRAYIVECHVHYHTVACLLTLGTTKDVLMCVCVFVCLCVTSRFTRKEVRTQVCIKVCVCVCVCVTESHRGCPNQCSSGSPRHPALALQNVQTQLKHKHHNTRGQQPHHMERF